MLPPVVINSSSAHVFSPRPLVLILAMGKALQSDTAQLMRLKKSCTFPEWSWCSSKGLTRYWLKNVRSVWTLLATHAHTHAHTSIVYLSTANLASVDTRTQPTTHLHLIPALWSICLGSPKPGIVYGCRVSHTHTHTKGLISKQEKMGCFPHVISDGSSSTGYGHYSDPLFRWLWNLYAVAHFIVTVRE